MYVLRNIEAHSCKYSCCKKALSITYSECGFVPLLIQHARCMQLIILLSLACLDLTYLYYVINSMVFRKTSLNTKWVLISSTLLSETFLSLRRFKWDINVNVHVISCNVPVILVRFKWNKNCFNTVLQKYSNVKYYENSFSGSRVVPCVRTD
jgi:hypothetical protein